ncbi:hypothetical protein EAG_15430 [Camponotus floridanus]|uniref:Uncharacterized protein n=1 Tax=Camponotus floridanus TaxID=104421 RepID=E2AXP0_CAMFO|nr:hypothetical protein EAG_15430 [Camponotus floridanus]
MDEDEIDGVKSPIKRLGSTRKLLVFNNSSFNGEVSSFPTDNVLPISLTSNTNEMMSEAISTCHWVRAIIHFAKINECDFDEQPFKLKNEVRTLLTIEVQHATTMLQETPFVEHVSIRRAGLSFGSLAPTQLRVKVESLLGGRNMKSEPGKTTLSIAQVADERSRHLLTKPKEGHQRKSERAGRRENCLIEESICGEDDKERGGGGEEEGERAEYTAERPKGKIRKGSSHSFRGGDRRFDRTRGDKRRSRGLARKEDEPGPPLRFAASRKQDRPRDGGIDGGGLRWNAVVRFNDSELRP